MPRGAYSAPWLTEQIQICDYPKEESEAFLEGTGTNLVEKIIFLQFLYVNYLKVFQFGDFDGFGFKDRFRFKFLNHLGSFFFCFCHNGDGLVYHIFQGGFEGGFPVFKKKIVPVMVYSFDDTATFGVIAEELFGFLIRRINLDDNIRSAVFSREVPAYDVRVPAVFGLEVLAEALRLKFLGPFDCEGFNGAQDCLFVRAAVMTAVLAGG